MLRLTLRVRRRLPLLGAPLRLPPDDRLPPDERLAPVERLELDELELELVELLPLSPPPPQAPSVMLRQTAAATAMTGRCDICIVTPQG